MRLGSKGNYSDLCVRTGWESIKNRFKSNSRRIVKALFKTFQYYICMCIYMYGMSHHIHSVRVMSMRREPRSVGNRRLEGSVKWMQRWQRKRSERPGFYMVKMDAKNSWVLGWNICILIGHAFDTTFSTSRHLYCVLLLHHLAKLSTTPSLLAGWQK